MLAIALLALAGGHRMDAPLPPRPAPSGVDALATPAAPREVGTPITIFVNFDGIDLGECNPSDALRDCSWYNFDRDFEPFTGSIQTQVSILQAMRRDVADYGIRITGQRPTSGDYMMVIYGGVEDDFGVLGSAPAEDCLDELPRQIAFAHLDGELNTWVNGGAMTALHEASHTWGLDHIDVERSVMFPSGDNSPSNYLADCAGVVSNTDLEPGPASCPDLNRMFCDSEDQQNSDAILKFLFGEPYVDNEAPRLELAFPEDGQYFQEPADFDVEFLLIDDQHPQAYDVWTWIGDDGPPSSPQKLVSPNFSVNQLTIGTWEFHVRIADEAGNETQLDFEIEVGEDPPPDPPEESDDDQGCACHAGGSGPGGVSGSALLGWLLVGLLARGRHRR